MFCWNVSLKCLNDSVTHIFDRHILSENNYNIWIGSSNVNIEKPYTVKSTNILEIFLKLSQSFRLAIIK